MNKEISLVIISAVFIVTILVAGCTQKTTQALTDAKKPIQQKISGQKDFTGNSFIASDKSLQSNYATLDVVYLDKPGYIVIQKDNNGKPGEIIGHSELISATKNNIKIAIDENIDVRAFAKIYYDNGDSIFNKNSDIVVESKNATIQLYKVGKGVSEPGKLISTEQFQSADTVASILEIYFSTDDKEFGRIQINKILWQDMSKSLKEGDIINVFFPYGTKERNEKYCPNFNHSTHNSSTQILPAEALGQPCQVIQTIDVKKGDKVLGSLASNLADTSYRRTTFSPQRTLSLNPTCEELSGKVLPYTDPFSDRGAKYDKCVDPIFSTSDTNKCCRRLCEGETCPYG